MLHAHFFEGEATPADNALGCVVLLPKTSGIAYIVGDVSKVEDAKGVYSAELEIGEVDKVVVYGTRNNKNYSGLWFYEVK